MSGTPKYSCAELDERRRERLERERRKRAAEEAQRRQEAEERERRRRMEELRAGLSIEANAARGRIQSQRNAVHSRDAGELETRCQKLVAALSSPQTENQLRQHQAEILRIARDFSGAVARKRRDDEEKKRLDELDSQRFLVAEIERRRSEIPAADASRFDPQGAASVKEAISRARSAVASGDPQAARPAVTQAEEALGKHGNAVFQRREEWQQQKHEAEQIVEELLAHIVGLRADPVLLRWHHSSIDDLGNQVREAKEALTAEQFKRPAEILAGVKTRSHRMIEEANQAQLKADQRDYIVNSIAQTLQVMNFTVAPVRAEHPGHPASAMTLAAAKGSNKSIFVSVPVEGQVMYTVDGFPMTTVATTGGGKAAVCDEAEKVLTEMQQNVEAAFGVKMGEIWWQEKGPQRRLQGEVPLGSPSAQTQRRK